MTAPVAIALGLLSFAVALGWAPWLLRTLRELKLGKQIRYDGPQSHLGKKGTPTMGGVLMVGTTTALTVIFLFKRLDLVLTVGVMLAFALFGGLDDFSNMRSRSGYGWPVRLKLALHTAITLGVGALLLYGTGAGPAHVAPVLKLPGGGAIELGWVFIPFAALVLFATSAAVNEIDGLDGLAGGTTAPAFAAYGLLAFRSGDGELAAFCAIMLGSIAAFLWYNVNPAAMFMGDTGSLGLGIALGMVALLSGWVLLLPVIGLILVLDTASVILQVGYFKYTKRRTGEGKRLFKMSPLHHHFELSGWTEVQTVLRFWLIAGLSAAAGLALAEL